MVPFNRVIPHVFYIVVLLCAGEVYASDDAYLKMLEGEAEDVELDQSGQIQEIQQETDAKEAIADLKWDAGLKGNKLPKGLAQDKFASFLKQNFFGTYVFYRKLNSVDQSTVYYHYTKVSSIDLDSIRQEIMNLIKR